jgi:hypothetical protein
MLYAIVVVIGIALGTDIIVDDPGVLQAVKAAGYAADEAGITGALQKALETGSDILLDNALQLSMNTQLCEASPRFGDFLLQCAKKAANDGKCSTESLVNIYYTLYEGTKVDASCLDCPCYTAMCKAILDEPPLRYREGRAFECILSVLHSHGVSADAVAIKVLLSPRRLNTRLEEACFSTILKSKGVSLDSDTAFAVCLARKDSQLYERYKAFLQVKAKGHREVESDSLPGYLKEIDGNWSGKISVLAKIICGE